MPGAGNITKGNFFGPAPAFKLTLIMNYFSSNVKLLRERKGITQDMLATSLGFTRSTLNSMENQSVKNPTIENLIKFSDYFKLPIDTLIRKDLKTMSKYDLMQLINTHSTNHGAS